MGSRIMHLITTDMVVKELSIRSENDFLLGTVRNDKIFTNYRIGMRGKDI